MRGIAEGYTEGKGYPRVQYSSTTDKIEHTKAEDNAAYDIYDMITRHDYTTRVV